LLGGCGSSTESRETQTSSDPRAVNKQVPSKMVFETRTDTVALQKTQLDSIGAHRTRELQVRYMVQIGAFKDPQYASAVQTTARERYHKPALNDYNTTLALYQIRIGFFETKTDAYAFRQRMRREYPNDYKDAWVVQLKR
jgi:cell division septation protein DedD